MRILIICLLLVQSLAAKDTLATLRTMKFEPEVREKVEEVMMDYYLESSAYLKNRHRIRNKMLMEMQNKGDIDFEFYENSLQRVSSQYVKSKIKFYRSLIEVLGKEKTSELIGKLRD